MESLPEVAVSSPEKGDARNLSDILNAQLDAAEKRTRDKASERKSKPSEEEKPVKEAPKGETDDEAPSKGGKKPAADGDKPKEPAKQAKVESDADKPFAPKSWTEEERKAFEASPPEVQSAINKLVKNLQGGFTKKTQALAEDQKFASEVRGVLQPHHMQLFKSHGMTEAQGIKTVMGLYDSATKDPVSFVKRMIQNSRIPLEALGIAAPQSGTQPAPETPGQPADPTVARLQEELNAIKGVLTQAHTQSLNTARQREEAAIAETHNVIMNFINEVDDAGMPAHPHWDTVQNHVLMIAKNDPDIADLPPREKLAAAYERAVWANPAAKAAMLEAERAKTAAEFEKERSRAAISRKPSSASGGVKAGKKPLDQIIRDRARKFGGL
jgi:hypothetical protein